MPDMAHNKGSAGPPYRFSYGEKVVWSRPREELRLPALPDSNSIPFDASKATRTARYIYGRKDAPRE